LIYQTSIYHLVGTEVHESKGVKAGVSVGGKDGVSVGVSIGNPGGVSVGVSKGGVFSGVLVGISNQG
jgi:hypothetical protein